MSGESKILIQQYDMLKPGTYSKPKKAKRKKTKRRQAMKLAGYRQQKKSYRDIQLRHGIRKTDSRHIVISKLAGEWFEGCHVHHCNVDHSDNRPENLIVLLPQEHMMLHGFMDKYFHKKYVAKEDVKKVIKILHYGIQPPVMKYPNLHLMNRDPDEWIRQTKQRSAEYKKNLEDYLEYVGIPELKDR